MSSSDPFSNIFGDLARLLAGQGQSGPLNWDVARQVAVLIAGEGAAPVNVDPIARMRVEELVRVAELHVQAIEPVVVRHVQALNHVEWAIQALDAYRTPLEQLAEGLRPRASDQPSDVADDPMSIAGPLGAMAGMADLEKVLGPVMLGMQAGGMVGHLARRSLGLYDLPIPRTNDDTIALLPANIAAFADDWTLPVDELTLYVAVEEVARLAVLSKPHVREHLCRLVGEYVAGFEPEASALQGGLEGLDFSDMSQLPGLLGDPNALLGVIGSPAQSEPQARLHALLAALCGWVDHVVTTVTVTGHTIPSAGAIAEAIKRRRVEESDGNRLVERLLGLELSQKTFDRGDAFVKGVLERAGEAGLARLWRSAHELPTPAEIDASGLWLERIDLPPHPAA